MNEEKIAEPNCSICNTPVKNYHKFCYGCGNNLLSDDAETSLYKNSAFVSSLTFFFIYLLICLIVHFTDLFSNYSKQFWIEVLIAAITLIYSQKNFSNLKQSLQLRNINFITVIVCIAAAGVLSFAVNIIVLKFNVSFFNNNAGYYIRYKTYAMPALLMIYSIALNPAIFEELAFRGVQYNYLCKFLNERSVVVVTAFMFAIVHLNLVSLVWLIPFGLIVGSLRKKFNTLWYGILFHFCFNLVTVVFDLYKNGYFVK